MGNDNIKTLEFDIDQLSYDKLNQLEKFVKIQIVPYSILLLILLW